MSQKPFDWKGTGTFSQNDLIKDVMKEKNMTTEEAFNYLYSQTPMPVFSVNTLIEYYEIMECNRVLTPEENRILSLLYSIKSYHHNGSIPVPKDLDTSDKFIEWLRSIPK